MTTNYRTHTQFDTGTVRSSDGAVIGYRKYGQGPGLILAHGALMTSQLFHVLATALADRFTVYAPDRRGRGLSRNDPDRLDHGLESDIADLTAMLHKTGARQVFGLSSGAIVALCTAMRVPQIDSLALYEPPLPIDGGAPLTWTPQLERHLDRNRPAAALATLFHATGDRRSFTSLPRFVLTPLLAVALRLDHGDADRPPLRETVPTFRADSSIVRDADAADTWSRVPQLECRTLLLGGTRSPRSLTATLDRLQSLLPNATRVVLPGVGHTAAFNDEKPELVAGHLHRFFAE